eukprot:Seg1248.2 transcript_id=Seg1248.2/GoldUCD/mRNA.D3Y31 product="putative transcriptional regulatory protein" protein_id=Seg1248.2/GoldUCD/D3Y31
MAVNRTSYRNSVARSLHFYAKQSCKSRFYKCILLSRIPESRKENFKLSVLDQYCTIREAKLVNKTDKLMMMGLALSCGPETGKMCPRRFFSTNFMKCMAGHSHWANIKFKKMHKDAERSKVFGKLSLEIITAVRENGPDQMSNSKLDGIISRAKAAKMPKDSIEAAIKSALRAGNEAGVQMLMEVRGPGRCGLLLDILSPNLKRTRPELKTILKKYGGVPSEEGSVSFMFQHKGLVTVEATNEKATDKSEVEDAAILSGAENFYFDEDDEGKKVIRFVCGPLEVRSLQDALSSEHGFTVVAANEEQIAKDLIELDENHMTQADKLIDHLSSHPDVMRIFDNIKHYPSSTFKIDQLSI